MSFGIDLEKIKPNRLKPVLLGLLRPRYVGYYLSTSAVLTFIGLLLIRETKDDDLVRSKV